ncbi:hypothetical protein CRENBAI_024003 [Crenichthys baileyi]|uniref:Uncharacterized protein n=1 Tax=Crenichthys baileyi TaxID=28760 RepID=A0AAV9RHP1_9TELE
MHSASRCKGTKDTKFPAETLSLRRRVEQFSWSEGRTTGPHHRGYRSNVQFGRPTERAAPPHGYRRPAEANCVPEKSPVETLSLRRRVERFSQSERRTTGATSPRRRCHRQKITKKKKKADVIACVSCTRTPLYQWHHTSTGQQFVPPKEQWADEQTETQICKQEENLTEEQPKMFAKEILSDKLEEPVFVLDLVPVSLLFYFQSSQKQKRQRKPLSNSLYILSTICLPNRPTTSPITS